MFYLIIIY